MMNQEQPFKRSKIILLFSFLIIISFKIDPHNDNMPEPYASIFVLTKDLHGWFSHQKNLKQLIELKKPKIVVEIGSWLGLSTIFIAKLLSKESKVYAVDHWLGQSYYSNPGPEITTRLGKLFHQFLSNVIHENLTNIIVPIRMPSLDAAQALNVNPDLIYIDGSHLEEDVYNDVMAWYPKMNFGAIMCGDDWAAESVRKGVRRAASKLEVSISTEGNFWYFQ